MDAIWQGFLYTTGGILAACILAGLLQVSERLQPGSHTVLRNKQDFLVTVPSRCKVMAGSSAVDCGQEGVFFDVVHLRYVPVPK